MNDTHILRSKQVIPLPISSGSNNPTRALMNQANIQLSMMTSQATANTKYDPPVPQPISKPITKEQFTSMLTTNSHYSANSLSHIFLVSGIILIVYSFISK